MIIKIVDKFIKNNANLSPLKKINPSEKIKIIVIKNNVNLLFFIWSKKIKNPNNSGKNLAR